uniref:Putative secreted protein n=1 Tax=Anopheles triannulatus TaxID=58253 RepID=A0A2M4B4R8_9DIPT
MRRSLMPLLVLLSLLLRPSYTCSSICSPPENSRLRFDRLSVPPPPAPAAPSPPFAAPVAPVLSVLWPSPAAAAATAPIADPMDGSVASPVAAGVATIVRPLLLLLLLP